MKKTLAAALSILALICLLAGCGAGAPAGGSDSYSNSSAPMAMAEEREYMVPAEDGFWGGEMAAEAPATELQSNEAAEQSSQKLIYRIYLDIETLDYDSSVNSLESLCLEHGGYFESANVSGNRMNGSGLRWASYVLRIPSSRLDDFESACGGIGNVYNSRRETENATMTYIDLDARRTAYKTEEERLLELLGQATDLDSIIALNTRLSEIRYELESIEASLRYIDSQVSYSTVYIELNEVIEETEVVVIPKTFSERVATASSNSFKSFKASMQDLGVALFGKLPLALLTFIIYILPLAVIAAVALLIIRRKRSKAKKQSLLSEDEKRQDKTQGPKDGKENKE